jgi:8-oxo-dGTP diphosphatase
MNGSRNPFESGERKVIPAVLVYARAGDRVLMVHRNAPDRPGDYHAGKWNGLGGKLEADESPLEAAQRELLEESGLVLPESAFRALGTLQFPLFKPQRGEDWLVWVFAADAPGAAWDGRKAGPEGDLHWVPAAELETLNLWAGDRHFIGHVVAGRPFVGTIWYRGAEAVRHWIQPLNQGKF